MRNLKKWVKNKYENQFVRRQGRNELNVVHKSFLIDSSVTL